MPRLTKSDPKYRRIRGQAAVSIKGKTIYLGKYDSPESHEAYARVIAEWKLAGKTSVSITAASSLTVNHLCLAYWKHAQEYYCKHGEPTDEQAGIKACLKQLRAVYGSLLIAEFGAKQLKTFRQTLIDRNLARSYINKQIGRVRRMFDWGADCENDLVPVSVCHSLQTLKSLKAHRSKAREPEPIQPVPDELFEATLKYVKNPTVVDMLRLQRLSGMRPGEVFVMRPQDIDRTGEVWIYLPPRHKNEHHRKQRPIALGNRAQAILRHYLLRPATAYCFERPSGGRFFRWNYQQAVEYGYRALWKARKKAFEEEHPGEPYREPVPSWHPHQLRHSAGSEFRAKYGLDAAQILLGHAQASTTERYAKPRIAETVAKIAKEVG